MSMVFPKNKEKRPRTSSNETNTSFVKNVTSRVSGLLPSTITKWFSSPSSSNGNGSAPTAEATDSSTEDEAPESPIVTQPPAKRMRFNSSNKFSHFGSTDVICTSSNIEITEIPVSHYPGAQFSTSRNSLTLTPIRNPNETITNESIREKNERDTSRFSSTQHTTSSIGHSVASKRKSIFDKTPNDDKGKKSEKSARQTSDIEKKPYFKPGLLGSAFYPGRTMYGGAASSYINQANIQQHTIAYVKETKSSDDSVMGSATRRIMDLLEAYSSPLKEARRIPQYTRPKTDRHNASSDRFTPYADKSLTYKTQELHVPNIANILRLKQKSRLMDTTKTARQIIASHSSASNYPINYPSATSSTTSTTDISQTSHSRQENQQPSKLVTKIKTKSHRIGIADELDLATPVKLPSATLQIDQNNLPKFNIDTPAVSKPPATSTPKVVTATKEVKTNNNNTEIPTSKPEIDDSSMIFKFSDPVRISCDSPDVDTTPPKFTFDSPERHVEDNFNSKRGLSSVLGNVKDTDNSTSKPKDWKCPDCLVNNKADVAKCVCCGHKVVNVSKCSVCKLADSLAQKDKCVTCEKMASTPQVKTTQSSKWKCHNCYVMNEADVGKCVCCEVNKQTEESKAAAVADVAAIPKVNAPTCGGCVNFGVGNWNTSSNSIKPISVPTTTDSGAFRPFNKTDSSFISIAKSQKSDCWECASCLVRNASNVSKCICCETEREPKDKLPGIKFNFGMNTNTSFKFGIDPKVQEATLAKKPEPVSTPEPKLKEPSETNNNVLAETPSFTLNIPAKKENQPGDLISKPGTAVKFSFGIPKDSPGIKSEGVKIPDEDNEKPQEVPQVNFATAVQETPKALGGLFTSPLTQQVDKDKPSMPATNFFTPPPLGANKESSNALNSIQSKVEETQSQTFTLGSSLRPRSDLFATPANVSSPTNPFTSPTAVATSASSMPLMLPIKMVNKSEDGISATSTPARTPMFTFGNNMNNSLTPVASSAVATGPTPADQPKFQFTFSSNPTKTDTAPSLLPGANTSSGFKPPFGSAGDSVNNSNNFSLTQGSSLGSANAIVLGGSKGLSANGLSGNGLPNNTLGGNTLGSNTLGGNTIGSNTLVGNTLGGNTLCALGSNTLGSTTLGVNSLGGTTLGGNILGGNALGGTIGNTTLGGNTMVGSTLTGNPLGGNTMPGNGLSGNLLGGNTLVGNSFSSNSLTAGIGVTSSNTLGSTNGMPGNHTGGNTLQANSNTLNSNSLTSGTAIIFGNSVQKENMWNSNNNTPSSNMFVSNTTTNNLQNPPKFTFGSTPFNATSPPPAFGNTAQPTQNMFGMANQNNNNQPSLFSSPVQNQSPAPMFGSAQPPSNPQPQMSMFGTPSIGAPAFGAPNPTFEAPSMSPAPASTFNFGAPSAQSAGIFGFGQQQPQQQPQQAGVYNFGGPQGAPQVQFNMGTAPNPAGRRMRKAARRTTPR